VASSQYTPRTYPAFTLLSRWTSPQTNAVLLQADAIASKDCASYYVIESRMPGAVVSHALGDACVGMTGPTIDRNSEGFSFVEALRPFGEAKAKQWKALTGDIVTSKVSWRPRSGTTMAGFVAEPRVAYAEPLEVTEFFWPYLYCRSSSKFASLMRCGRSPMDVFCAAGRHKRNFMVRLSTSTWRHSPGAVGT